MAAVLLDRTIASLMRQYDHLASESTAAILTKLAKAPGTPAAPSSQFSPAETRENFSSSPM